MTSALLVELAWKSTLTLGATLLLLRLLRHRSAAERSWLAHAGLLFTLLLPLWLLVMPRWEVEAPAPVVDVLAPAASLSVVAVANIPAPLDTATTVTVTPELPAAVTSDPIFAPIDTALLIYGLPAALLLGLTLVAVMRLFGLRRRADVLVESGWLSALALAQRRMGFKNGTALLVSADVGSPVSWGLLRPVILLNEAALDSREQAEAVIAHELAHVANFDWVKLLLARVTAALFWFNPLVWVLTKQCHQLREEAADDAVLSHDVPDLDYAELLVGVARHESGALLLAAHGVAPSRGSLAQRVTRVLDTSLRRAPARFGWTAGITFGALVFAAPLAALSLGAAMPESGESHVAMAMPAPAPLAPVAALAPPAPPAAQVDPVKALVHAEEQVAMAFAAVDAGLDFDAIDDGPASVRHHGDAPWKLGKVIPLSKFQSISLSGGGQVVLRHGRQSQARILSGDPTGVVLAVSGQNLAISGGGGKRPLIIEVTTAEVEAIAIHGGGDVLARGSFPAARDLAVAIHGGGYIDASAIVANDVAASIRGGGAIETFARRDLAASVTGGGDIRYHGTPEVASAIQGGGTVTRKGD